MKKTILFALTAFILIYPSMTRAAPCPLQEGRAYKIKNSPTVYLITAQCRKQYFSRPRLSSTYFPSWKNARLTNKKTLDRIAFDAVHSVPAVLTSQVRSAAPIQPPTPAVPSPQPKATPPPSVMNRTLTVQPKPPVPVAPPEPRVIPSAEPPLVNTTPSGAVAQYLECPSQAEIDQLEKDFKFYWPDYRRWPAYDKANIWDDYPYKCDFEAVTPSRLAVYNKFLFLKHLEFSKPLPFTGGVNIYDYITLKGKLQNDPIKIPNGGTLNSTSVIAVNTRLNCDSTSSGARGIEDSNPGHNGGFLNIFFGSSMAYMTPYHGDFSDDPYRCNFKSSSSQRDYTDKNLLNGYIFNPVILAGLIVHEFHHPIAFVAHKSVNPDGKPNGKDKTIEEMGAWAAAFYFEAWVNLYATNVDDNTKAIAKERALAQLYRIDEKCPSDAELRSVVNQIAGNICP